MSQDLYFYQGKFRTEEGLKRALIKDGTVWVSKKQNYYWWEKQFEYYYDFEMLRDYVTDYELCTKEEAKHFRKWLNNKIKEGEITVLNTMWYHSDATDGIGCCEFWECLDAIRGDAYPLSYTRDYDYFIETVEQTVEDYGETISEEEWKEFLKLPDAEQEKIAMKWRINDYKRAKEVSAGD